MNPKLTADDEIIQNMSQPAPSHENYVLTLEEIGNLAAEGGNSAASTFSSA
jgi:hypothetical protein